MKDLTTRVPNLMQIYFLYSTVTSACQWSLLACTRTVTIFRTLTYMPTRFVTKTNHFTYVSEWNKYGKSIATYLFYQHTPIDTVVYVCYNHKTKYTDWCPIQSDSGWGICLRMWKRPR